MLSEVLASTDRDIVVLGHNDQKPGKDKWPGWEGANQIASQLRINLPGRTVRVAMPPTGFKDFREYVCHRIGRPLRQEGRE